MTNDDNNSKSNSSSATDNASKIENNGGEVCAVPLRKSFASVVSGTATITPVVVSNDPAPSVENDEMSKEKEPCESTESSNETVVNILRNWLESCRKYRSPNDHLNAAEQNSKVILIKTAVSKSKFRRAKSLMGDIDAPFLRARRIAHIALDEDEELESEPPTLEKLFKRKLNVVNWNPNDQSMYPDRPRTLYDAGLFLRIPEMSTWEPYGPKNRTIAWAKYPPPMSLTEAQAECLFAQLEPVDPRPKYRVTKQLSAEEIEKLIGPMLPNPMSDLLVTNGLGQYVNDFIRESVDLAEFRLMTDVELRLLGVGAYLDRKKMHQLISEMNRVSPPFEDEFGIFDNIDNGFNRNEDIGASKQNRQEHSGFSCFYYV